MTRHPFGTAFFALLLSATPLWTPAVWAAHSHSVVEGDSWASLAKRYWGSAQLGDELAYFSAISGPAELTPGTTLRLPELVEEPIQPGQTLVRISRREYGGLEHAGALARLNRIADADQLHVGQRVRVPVLEAARAPEARDSDVSAKSPAAVEKSEAPRGDLADLDRELRAAEGFSANADFEIGLAEFERLRVPVMAQGSHEQQARLLRGLIFVNVAYERDAEACRAFRALQQIEAEFSRDPDQVSPRVLGVIARCDHL